MFLILPSFVYLCVRDVICVLFYDPIDLLVPKSLFDNQATFIT